MMIFGIRAYLIFFIDKTVRAIYEDSNAMASVMNFGSPRGMPNMPMTLIAIKITTIFLFNGNLPIHKTKSWLIKIIMMNVDTQTKIPLKLR